MSLYEGKVGDLIKSADSVVDMHASLRVNGKVSSLRTQEYSKQLMRETCRRLHKLGFYLENISGLSEKHIRAIVESWHKEGKSNKTHTHPQPIPKPSSEDLTLASDYALAAKATLTGLVFAIVGQSPFPAGLAVWVHDGQKNWVAKNIQTLEL